MRTRKKKGPTRRSVLLVQTWWQERILRGVADYAFRHNWVLDCRMRWTRKLPKVQDWRGDGILAFAGVAALMREASRPLVSFVRQAGVPVVEMQSFVNYFGGPKVVSDHEAIGRMAAEHFIELNYQHLGYVTFDENPLEVTKRVAFRQAAEAAGRTFHALTPRSLARAIARLPRPMALFTMNDPNALEVIRQCGDAGFHVPEEFAVLGVDDSEILCDLATVPLSSVNCDFERLGYEAAATLDRVMNGEAAPATPILIPPKGVTVRRSTDIIAIPDRDAARMLRALRDRFRERCGIQQIVGELGVPLRRVHAHFCEHVGHTMLHELTRLRVEHAKRLLADPKLKLEVVARESGFSNRFHLIQGFRRATGLTPKMYRRKISGATSIQP